MACMDRGLQGNDGSHASFSLGKSAISGYAVVLHNYVTCGVT